MTRTFLLTLASIAALLPSSVARGLPAPGDLVDDVAELVGAHHDAVRDLAADLSPDELPVPFFLAERAGVDPLRVAEAHRRLGSWMEVALHFDLSPEVFYVPFERDPGPPYGKAWGYWRKHPRSRWSQLRLSDAEISGLVTVRLLSDRLAVEPSRALELHRSRSLGEILHDGGGAHGHARGGPPGHAGQGPPGHAKDKGKGKGKGKG